MIGADRERGWRPAVRSGLTLATEIVLFGLALWAVFVEDTSAPTALLIWTLVALAYLVVGGVYARRDRHAADRPSPPLPWWDRTGMGGWFRTLFPVLASLVGLASSLSVLLVGEAAADDADALRALGVVTMVEAWLLLHVGYARRYQRDHHRLGNRGLEFPGTEHPRLTDFLYFALTVGTTFATSDVSVTDRSLRWTTMVHSILGFFYNAVVLAVAFKIITSL